MKLYSAGSSHINGRTDIDFMEPFNVKSKAQVRDSLRAVQGLYTSWNRTSGYKTYSSYDLSRQKPSYVGGTCSTVTCHNGTPMEWRSKGPLPCAACHTSLTN
jgi:predicted CxxxxCH...CXXCH cytochrome family protein